MSADYDDGAGQLINLTRRQALKTGAGALAAGAGAGALDPAKAQIAIGSGWGIGAKASNATEFVFGKVSDALGGSSTNKDPQTGNISFHQTVKSASEWWQEVAQVWIENALNDAPMVAHVQARNAVADAYEQGKTDAEAAQDAADAIDEYLTTPWINTYAAFNMALLQCAYVAKTAREAPDDAIDTTWRGTFWTPPNSNYTGSGSIANNGYTTGISTTPQKVTLVPPNGEEIEREGIMFQAEWDNGDSWSGALDQEFLDAYNESNDNWTFTTDQGNELTDSFGPISGNSVPEADLWNVRVTDGVSELIDYLNQIEQTASDIKSNYPVSFISDLYAAMDEGKIDPADVRGAAGYAELLSGSTDASQGSYQLALSSLLDTPRTNLEDVSTMTVEYTGYTDREYSYNEDAGQRVVRLAQFENDSQYKGQLFAERVPPTLASDGIYLIDPPIVIGTSSGVVCKTPAGTTLWSDTSSYDDSGFNAVYKTEADFTTAYAATYASSGNAYLRAHNLMTGKVEWEYNYGDYQKAQTWALSRISDSIVMGTNDLAICINAEDGTKNWDYSIPSQAEDVCPSPDGESVIVGVNSGEVYSLGLTNGGENWSREHGRTVSLISSSDTIYQMVGDGTFRALNALGAEQWSVSISWPGTDESPKDASLLPDGRVQVTSSAGTVKIIDPSSQSVAETIDHSTTASLWTLPGSRHYVADQQVWDSQKGEAVSSLPAAGDNVATAGRTTASRTPVDGLIVSGRFIAAGGDGGSEIIPMSGELTINSMSDPDGNSVEQVDTTQDWGPPEYDTTNTDEYANYVEKTSEKQGGALSELTDDGGGGVSLPDIGGGGILGGIAGAIGTAAFFILLLFVVSLINLAGGDADLEDYR